MTALSAALLLVSTLSVSADTLKVFSVQMQVSDSLEQNAQTIAQGLQQAKQAGARVAVFPETALSGFHRETVEKLDWEAVEAAMTRVSDTARGLGLYVIYGCATRSGKDKPYNTAVVLGPDGKEITRYHKMFCEDWFSPGEHLALFEIDGVPCAMNVCHDERFPELMKVPVIAGARVCFYISYEINSRRNAERKADGYRAQLVARAVENGIWVVQSNGVGPLGESRSVSLGQSRIVAPDGEVVEQAPALQEAVLSHTLRIEAASRKNALETLENPLLRQWYLSAQALIRPYPKRTEAKAERDQVRIALMRGVPEKWNLDKNFETFLHCVEQAGDAKASIFITPECWLDGYAAPDKQSTPERLREVSQALDTSPYLQRVSEEARKRKMYVCFGFTSLEHGAIYNAAGLWDDQGKLVGVYHKTHLQTHDLQVSPGDSLPVWPSPWGPLGIMICADRRWPETARTLRLQGARLILNPTYGMSHEKNEWWMRTRGYENQCFIAFTHPKVGLVVDPKGDIAAKQEGEDPGVLVCDLDLTKAKEDNHLSDRRPELYLPITMPPEPAADAR